MGLVRRKTEASNEPPIDEPPATERLRHRSAVVRRGAATELAGDPDAVPALLEAFAKETERGPLIAMLDALVVTGGEAVVVALIPYLKTDDIHRRNGAVEALTTHIEHAAPHIPRLLRDPDPDVRLLTLDVLRDMEHEEGRGLAPRCAGQRRSSQRGG